MIIHIFIIIHISDVNPLRLDTQLHVQLWPTFYAYFLCAEETVAMTDTRGGVGPRLLSTGGDGAGAGATRPDTGTATRRRGTPSTWTTGSLPLHATTTTTPSAAYVLTTAALLKVMCTWPKINNSYRYLCPAILSIADRETCHTLLLTCWTIML